MPRDVWLCHRAVDFCADLFSRLLCKNLIDFLHESDEIYGLALELVAANVQCSLT